MNWLKQSSPFTDTELIYGPSIFDAEHEEREEELREGREEFEFGEKEEGWEEEYSHGEFPQVLLIVDVQEEFNKHIHFDCRQFLHYVRESYKSGTEVHIVYDQLADGPPQMFSGYATKFYEKAYGADPYHGVIDKNTEEKIDSSEMDEGVLYYDPEARLDIFVSSGHDFQHVWPDMVDLVNNIRGKQVKVVGGAAYECLADILTWLNMNDISYEQDSMYTYGSNNWLQKISKRRGHKTKG